MAALPGECPALVRLALDYRDALAARMASITPPALWEGLEKIQDAANALRLALLQAPAEVLDEIAVAGMLAGRQPKAYQMLVHHGQEAAAYDLPTEPHQSSAPWVRRLHGLETLTGWIAGELRQGRESKGKKSNHETWAESADTKLFRECLGLLQGMGIGLIHLRPIARVVRAWAWRQTLFEEEQEEPTWANREGSRVREEFAEARRFMFEASCFLMVRALHRKARRSNRIQTGRTGKIHGLARPK